MNSRYHIRQVDPRAHASAITALWKQLLPGTPAERLDWLQKNPAGNPTWWLAFSTHSGELAGTISMTRKRVHVDGNEVTLGVLGDLMIPERHRVFGPGLQLLKTAVEDSAALGVTSVYTIPNSASAKLAERVGLSQVGTLCHLVKPIHIASYLRKVPAPVARIAGAVGDVALRLSSRETFRQRRWIVEEVRECGSEFDSMEPTAKNGTHVVSDCSRHYVQWRYFANPMYDFRVLAVRERDSSKVMGFLPFVRTDDRLHIFDLVASHPQAVYALLGELARIGRAEHCRAVYVRLSLTNHWRPLLRSCRFFDTHDNAPIFGARWAANRFNSWAFFSSDRNI